MEARSLKLFKALTESLLKLDPSLITMEFVEIILEILTNVM